MFRMTNVNDDDGKLKIFFTTYIPNLTIPSTPTHFIAAATKSSTEAANTKANFSESEYERERESNPYLCFTITNIIM